MPQTAKEKKRNAYARRQRAWEVMKSIAARHGYTVTGKDVSGVDEFIDALESGEAIILLKPEQRGEIITNLSPPATSRINHNGELTMNYYLTAYRYFCTHEIMYGADFPSAEIATSAATSALQSATRFDKAFVYHCTTRGSRREDQLIATITKHSDKDVQVTHL